MKLSKQGRDFIIGYEKRMASVYRDSAGLPTIGIGHLITEAELATGVIDIQGVRVKWRTAKLTDAIIDALFDQDLAPREMALNRLLSRAPTQQQFDAMLALIFNIGVGSNNPKHKGGFTRSTVRRKFNAGDLAGAADAFKMWNKAGGKVSNGLVKRRAAERHIFLHGEYDHAH